MVLGKLSEFNITSRLVKSDSEHLVINIEESLKKAMSQDHPTKADAVIKALPRLLPNPTSPGK